MFAMIMAGGSGTRFWPASRERRPKQFLKIISDCTMFEETLARVRHFADDDHIYTVVGHTHAELVRTLLGQSSSPILIEPFGRNTAACIGLAAVHIKKRALDEPIVVLPADHFIADAKSFAQTIHAAAQIAREGAIITLGITPTRPETGYGYIEIGAEAGHALDTPFFRAERFVEKPNPETALRFLTSHRHLWNSGIFIFTARTILREIDICLPTLAESLEEIERAIDQHDYANVLARVYERLEPISIDHGVMERTQNPILVFRAEFGWSDIGSWQALYELRSEEYDANENLLLGEAVAINAKRNLVYSEAKRLIALLGVEDLMIVDTPDAVLVARLDCSQEVKKFPDILKERNCLEV